jgi:hypothetical protein
VGSRPAYTRFIPNALAPIFILKETTMTTITNKQTVPNTAPSAPFSLIGFIETLLAVRLREQLDADTKGDKSDAAFHWGM